jgi:hypothetical protein
MLTEDTIARKKLGCLDLVAIAFNIDKAGIKYTINNDGSLSVFDVSFALVKDFDDHKTSGYIGDVDVEGYFDVINHYPRVDLVCNKYSRRVAIDN